MIFVTGGSYSGKRKFVQDCFSYGEEDFTTEINTAHKVFYQLEEQNCKETEKLLLHLLEKEVVICSEIGCGIIPLEKKDRIHREEVGRIACLLAQKATEVYRVTAGIGVKIK